MSETNDAVAQTQHPLAVPQAELVREGKYDGADNRVAPLQVNLIYVDPPFNTDTDFSFILGNDTTKTVKVK